MDQIPDREAREAAETTFDRNIVLVAGAGTGKTTSLVNRMVHLLIKEPSPVAVTQIVALTFTNKAATEMKVRLRERLAALVDPRADAASSYDGGAVSPHDLQARYGLTRDEIAARAKDALQDLEKAQIGTLHSFAAHLLRLYPLESAVDPAFQEDDGLRFDEHFTQAWDLWIDRELSRQGTHHELWRRLLESTTVEELRSLTYALCSEFVDLDVLQYQLEDVHLNPLLVEWIGQLASRARIMLESHDRQKRRKIEQMLAATVSVLSLLAEGGVAGLKSVDPSHREWLDKDVGNPVGGWEKAEYQEASGHIEIATQLLGVDHTFFNDLLRLIAPLARTVRTSFSDKGWLSFDGLLARARRLLWEHRAVRERVKQEYRAVLVDEFQDTDPVQYEIILAVSERQGHHALAWQEMALEPGKLFIVGDPKQSIYAFRRADIEAFDRVVEKVASDRGIVHTLTTNFRSDAAVLGPINDVFDRLFIRRPLVQPANVRLEVRPQRQASSLDPGVQVLVTAPQSADETFDAAGAVRAEGEVLARWLKEDILPRPNMSAGHVALLFRKLTQADAYVDALRRYDIPYLIEGEKHFYRRQEVIDLVNVLRVLDHPHDRIALTGVLRSPLGGLTDRDLFDLQQAGLLDYLAEQRLESFNHPRAAAVRRLFGQLAALHRGIAALPLAEAVQLVFDRLPILELAAASLHGEQAVANLLKVKQTAASLSDRPHLTLSGFVELMVERLDDQPEEAESPLAEETSDAVKILTIHKAKGLEFPVVVLPGLHQRSGRDRPVPSVAYDWSSATYGLSLGKRRTLGAVVAHAKFAVREEAERRRVLYVGMTRAKEMLVLSGGLNARSVGENTLEWLQEIGQGAVGDATTQHVQIGTSAIPHRVIKAPERKWPKRSLANVERAAPVDPSMIARLWEERSARWTAARQTAWRLTPSSLEKEARFAPIQSRDRTAEPEAGRLVGVLAHRVLERWDFQDAPDGLLNQIDPAIQASLTPDRVDLRSHVAESLHELFSAFARSDLYMRLRSAAILGREVPFLMPWGDGQMMEGVIDLIYRLDGHLWIADYKTDRVAATEVQSRAKTYASQAAIYREAACRCLNLSSVSFQFLFLRPGVSIEI
jgi:ATP-dependent helicase/nuclease subunit A